MSETQEVSARTDIPKSGLAGLIQNLRFDMLSGFLVFLIALPLCLGIATASGFPPVAGLFTAIAGGFICSFISDSELTIKGPAAGMIGIVSPAIIAFGAVGKYPDDMGAYQAILAVALISGVIQLFFGLFRIGALADFFPTAAVHGLLASIGIIIIAKQMYFLLDMGKAPPESLEAIKDIPHHLLNTNPEVDLIGLISLTLMFALPFIKRRVKVLAAVPAQLIVLIVAVPLAAFFDFKKEHQYVFEDTPHEVSDRLLVNVPDNLASLKEAIVMPDFGRLSAEPGKAANWIIMFALIGSLESLLSAKAVDLIDPWRRKTNLNRDLMAVGVANAAVAAVGGLPMISEIVRSQANKDNGARTRWANMFHGLFLLLSLVFLPGLIRMIPLSALAAMLVYTGFRLASPKEFYHMYKIGPEQLVVFVSTIIGVLATDLLKGIAIGVAVKIVIHLFNGVHPLSFFKPDYTLDQVSDEQMIVHVKRSLVFSSWIPFRNKLLKLTDFKQVTIDLSQAKFVDHTVMAKLQETQRTFSQRGSELLLRGLEDHKPFSDHPLSARKKSLAQ